MTAERDERPTGHRFTPQQRLRKRSEFSRVFANNVRSSDGLFSVLASRNDEGHARLGMAVSRKAARSAVARNRVKRVVRDHFRHTTDALPPVDLVVIARPGIARRHANEMRQSLKHHWRRIAKQCNA